MQDFVPSLTLLAIILVGALTVQVLQEVKELKKTLKQLESPIDKKDQ